MAEFHLSEVDIRWSGTDDTTPPGHCIATGLDMFDNLRVWLFEGSEPSDAGYRGNLLLPRPENPAIVSAYGAHGGYVRSGRDQTELLRLLAGKG